MNNTGRARFFRTSATNLPAYSSAIPEYRNRQSVDGFDRLLQPTSEEQDLSAVTTSGGVAAAASLSKCV
jgi:hypothetical protein